MENSTKAGIGTENAFWHEFWEFPKSDFRPRYMTVLDNKLYAFSATGKGMLPVVYELDTGEWHEGAHLDRSVDNTCYYAVVGNTIYHCIGGIYNPGQLWAFDTQTEDWSLEHSFQIGTGKPFSISSIGQKIYLVFANSSLCYCFDVETKEIDEIHRPRMFTGTIATFVLDGKLYVSLDGNFEIYAPEDDSWITCERPPDLPLLNTNAHTVLGTDIYFLGGMSYTTGTYYKDGRGSLVFDTLTHTFREGPKMPLLTWKDESCAATMNSTILCSHYTAPYIISLDTTGGGLPQPGGQKLYMLMDEGETSQLCLTRNLADNALFSWRSTQEGVCTVDAAGVVHAHAPGTSDVYAESDALGIRQMVPVKVADENQYLLSVYLNLQQTQKCWFSNGPVEWDTLNHAVATVNPDGVATGQGSGRTFVTAAEGGARGSLRLLVP